MKLGQPVEIKNQNGKHYHSLQKGSIATCVKKGHREGYWILKGLDKLTGRMVEQMVFEDDFRKV